jgi:xanthine/uracil permease
MSQLWTLHGDGKNVETDAVVKPGERLTWPRMIGLGGQHVVAMFGATFLVPVLTGFPPATTLLFSGIGTLLFLLITKNRLPSYLGSSFAFIAPITAAVASTGMGGSAPSSPSSAWLSSSPASAGSTPSCRPWSRGPSSP